MGRPVDFCQRAFVLGLLLFSAATAVARPQALLITPAAGTRYVAPAGIALAAQVTADPGRSVARVEFRADGDLIGTASSAPYVFSWANVPAGNYTLRARVIDDQGAQDNSPGVVVRVRNNTAPRVRLTAPTPHRYVAPGSIPLTATVTDRDDPITKVEIFNGATLLTTLNAEPFAFDWTGVATGDYELTAKATDVLGAIGTSNALRVRVRDNRTPRVRILTPTNNTSFAAPATVPISVRAVDRDDNLTQVEFFANGNLLATLTTPPFDFAWSNVLAGTYVLTARATDDLGLITTSNPITAQVTGGANQPPTISITSPADTATFNAPANITLTANAADSDGTIAKVDFYFGDTLITTRTSAPYSFIWTGVPQGTYVLTAQVTDSGGSTVASVPVSVSVNPHIAKLYFIHVDHLNTPRLVADELQRAVWRWDQQEPFGVNAPDENPLALGAFDFPLRLPGQYFDKETSLSYNYFRTYDPGLGRYTRSDPIGLRGGLNTYAYVEGQPLRYVDPFGLDETIVAPGPGRSIADGPRNGNWCGANWSGGQVPLLHGGKDGTANPVDSLDRCCMGHDQCIGRCERILDKRARETCVLSCDKGIVSCLRNLDDDCMKWPQPPRAGTEGDSQVFRDDAIRWFDTEVKKRERQTAGRL